MEMPSVSLAQLSSRELAERLESFRSCARERVEPGHELEKLVVDLQLHQIELEIQNRALREAQSELEVTRSRYADLYHHAPVGYVSLDGSATIVGANQTALALFGHRREVFLRAPFAAAARLRDPASFFSHLRECVVTSRTVETEIECARADGTPLLLRLTFEVERSRSGDRVGYRITLTDLTETRRARSEKLQLEAERRARAEADAANHMKDQFLGIVSHELRTPLNAILGWTQMARTRSDDAEIVHRAIDVTQRNAETLARIVDDILDVSRIVNGKLHIELARADFADAVKGALELTRPLAQAKGVELRESVCAEAPLRGDAVRLEQVVSNLLSNAVKFTPPGGHVSVVLARVDGRLRLTIGDDGCGIGPQDVDHVFEMFRQADSSTTRSHAGLGLGLAIAQHIVVAHGGSIHVRSDGAGKGSIFTVELSPANFSTPPPRQPPSTREVNGTRSLEGVRVLFVDDEPAARDLAELALSELGATVATADSVETAIERLVASPPDILVSDIGMPRRDGYDFIREVRAIPAPLGNVPAIALTAYARLDDAHHALEAGFTRHLAKPVHSESLAAMIVTLVRPAGR
jgi:PAS domain S-box-containing protein